MANRLAGETSPYLLQHAENPVDWYPWGSEAFDTAAADDKPIFLSVGYAACHWCHVMAHESFEDPATAAILNREFVPVKVDREERPDVDAIYMDAVQAMTGGGGWPMSVFLTPDGVPFFGGTYFPHRPIHGMPAFDSVLNEIVRAWKHRREEVLDTGELLTEALKQGNLRDLSAPAPLTEEALDAALGNLVSVFDETDGGFGGAPKFPQPVVLEFLLRRHLATADEEPLSMVTLTLDRITAGGIHDHLGGGFHRYATDREWLVPHFEKMLYDNAQLARLYLHAWQVTGERRYRDVAESTLDYMIRELRHEGGGFYASQDADSEGVEGRYYVWTADAIEEALGAPEESGAEAGSDVRLFFDAYGIDERGNFEGETVLHVSAPLEKVAARQRVPLEEAERRLAGMRAKLLEARAQRAKPARDEKIVASWNGLALAAFAEASRVLRRDDYLDAATGCAEFLLREMRTPEGRMRRSWKDGRANVNGFLEDYADVADGLLALYAATFDPRWFAAARELADAILDHFLDPSGGFFDTSDDHEKLLLRPKGPEDTSEPSGGSAATSVLQRLAAFTGEARYAEEAEEALSQVESLAEMAPLGFANWLSALQFELAPAKAVAVVGEGSERLLDAVFERYRPDVVVAAGRDGVPLLEGRATLDGQAAAYVCRGTTCDAPVTDPADLGRSLEPGVGRP